MFLRGKDFVAEGEVRLIGATIGGQLDCSGGAFRNATGRAFDAEAAKISADVYLQDGTFDGAIDFTRADITGSLQFHRAQLSGAVDLEASRIGAGLFWKDVRGKVSDLNLVEAYVSALRDDNESWDAVEAVHIAGFCYDRINSEMTLSERLDWLSKARQRFILPSVGRMRDFEGFDKQLRVPLLWLRGPYKDNFDPQPYSQLAKVLTESGDRIGAARVLTMREKRQRRAAWHRSHARLDGTVDAGLKSIVGDVKLVFDWMFGWLFG